MRFPPENDEEGKEGGREGGLSSCFTEEARRVIENTPELCYLTHVVLRMFEDLDKHEDDPTRFRIEILFSPGKDFSPFFLIYFYFYFIKNDLMVWSCVIRPMWCLLRMYEDLDKHEDDPSRFEDLRQNTKMILRVSQSRFCIRE